MNTVETINIHFCGTTRRYVARVHLNGKQKFVARTNTINEALAAQTAFIKALKMVGVVCVVSGKKQK